MWVKHLWRAPFFARVASATSRLARLMLTYSWYLRPSPLISFFNSVVPSVSHLSLCNSSLLLLFSLPRAHLLVSLLFFVGGNKTVGEVRRINTSEVITCGQSVVSLLGLVAKIAFTFFPFSKRGLVSALLPSCFILWGIFIPENLLSVCSPSL